MSRLEQRFSHNESNIFITAFSLADAAAGWDVLVSVQPAASGESLRRVAVESRGFRTAREAVSEALEAARSYIDQDTARCPA